MDEDVDNVSDDDISSGSTCVSDMRLSSQHNTHLTSHQDPTSSKSHLSYSGDVDVDLASHSFKRSGSEKSRRRTNILEDVPDDGSYEYSEANVQEHELSGTLANDSINETSLDETSFTNSICSEKENGRSSELSVDPVVWKKFKFLSSILKETQHNLRAMDDLILEHRRLQDLTNLQVGQNRSTTSCSHLSLSDQQKLGEGEPKTDEAKLEEILGLLHNLTDTLSSYEQHPLLV